MSQAPAKRPFLAEADSEEGVSLDFDASGLDEPLRKVGGRSTFLREPSMPLARAGETPSVSRRKPAGVARQNQGQSARGSLGTYLAEAAERVEDLLAGALAGMAVRDGLRVVVVGKPNVGKSSLFNALARENAAIVTGMPGTTRDALDVWIDVRGVPVLLTDTAGIHAHAEGEVETLGIERAREKYQEADVSIFLLDGSRPLSQEDADIAHMLDPEKNLLVVINKADLPQAFDPADVAALLPDTGSAGDILQISLIGDEANGALLRSEGMPSAGAADPFGGVEKSAALVENRLEAFALSGAEAGVSLLVTKARHKALLEQARLEIIAAQAALADGEAPEFAEVNIRAAWESLGEITGETAADDVIDRVFAEFCVGK